jgi:hypothetical protein
VSVDSWNLIHASTEPILAGIAGWASLAAGTAVTTVTGGVVVGGVVVGGGVVGGGVVTGGVVVGGGVVTGGGAAGV